MKPESQVALPAPRRERGSALLIILTLIGIGAAFLLVSALNKANQQIERDKITAAALAQAKEALISFAATSATLPGSLPCPDTNNDGSGDNTGTNCTAYIGRLPWKQLKLPDLRDGSGECLWYALSPVFRNVLPAASRSPASNSLNNTTAGQLTVSDTSGIPLPTPPNPVIAVIFSTGTSLPGQNRAAVGATICGGNNNAANYLDTAAGISNATGGGTGTSFIAADASSTFNDKLIYITASQFFPSVNKRVVAEIRGLSQPPTSGLRKFYNTPTNHYYPCAANAGSAGSQVTTPTCLNSGLIPFSVLSFDSSTLIWLTNNNWFPLTSYAVAPNFMSGTLYPQQCGAGGAGCLTVNSYVNSQAQVTVGGISTIVCTINGKVTSCPYP
jgi:type II secretory pathway pseudopilin PulG